jgi:hypothetical protein
MSAPASMEKGRAARNARQPQQRFDLRTPLARPLHGDPHLQRPGGVCMRPFGSHYRDLPRFFRRRVERTAGEVNAFLIVVALGLAMLDLLYLAQRFVDALPPAVMQMSPPTP